MACSQLTDKERTYTVLAVIFGLLAVIAIIVSGVSLSRPGTPVVSIKETSGRATTPASGQTTVGHVGVQDTDPKAVVWTIAVGHGQGVQGHLDENGYIKGFGPDLIHEVCSITRLHCRLIWDRSENCWNSEPGRYSAGGQGLMGKWYDACAGWMRTVDREQVFDFSVPYLHSEEAHFYVKTGNSNFDIKNIGNKKIGFLNGWASDETCLTRVTGKQLSTENVIYSNEKSELLRLLNSGQIDAAFVTEGTLELEFKSKRVEIAKNETGDLASFNCVIGGVGLMTRKDSPFLRYWDYGFSHLVRTKRFETLCKLAKQNHGHQGSINCVSGNPEDTDTPEPGSTNSTH